MTFERGTVVKGPDLFADHDHRPYVYLSDDSHPFSDEEALYAAITTTPVRPRWNSPTTISPPAASRARAT